MTRRLSCPTILPWLAAAACAGAPRASTPEEAPGRALPRPVTLGLPSPTPAPWLEPAFANAHGDDLVNAMVSALGERAALLYSREAYYAVDLARGAAGPIALPEDARWHGIGGIGDQLFVATADDRLLRAPHPAIAAPSDLVEIAAFPGAWAWAAAPGTVAVAVGDTVHVSRDGGASFSRTQVAPGFRVEVLLARADGLLVAQGRERAARGVRGAFATMISKDRRTWVRSTVQNPERLWQVGGWIRSDATACAKAVLAADGDHWIALADPSPVLRKLASVADLVEHGEDRVAHGPRDFLTARFPPPPAFDPAREVAGVERGGCRPSMIGGVHVKAVPHRGPGPDRLGGVRGAAGEWRPGARALEILENGACAAADADADGRCREGAALDPAPDLVLVDRAGAPSRIVEPPAGCVPAAARSAPGLGLVLCEAGDRTRVVALDAGGGWHEEGELAGRAPFDAIDIAADGTIAVFPACGEEPGRPCRAWIRSPRPIGDAAAWRVLDDGEAYRVGPGGAALVIGREGADAGSPDVVLALDRPDQARRRLARIRLTASLLAARIEGDQVKLEIGAAPAGVLYDDGSVR